jgi:hypothetical protein
MMAALAGRRIDAPGTKPPRFPLENSSVVESRIHSLFEQEKPAALVCSAANGADLLALECAGELFIERHILLPFPPEVFRRTSVIDRPGPWGDKFDRILKQLRPGESLISLDYSPSDPTAYAATNRSILTLAQRIGSRLQQDVMAVLVWNGSSRGEHDKTQQFRKAAVEMGLPVKEILTL